MDASSHTILLVQFGPDTSSRTYEDFETTTEAFDGICRLYEQALKEANPTLPSVTYDLSELFKYIDGIGDICVLVFNDKTSSYEPHTKEWIKTQLFHHLKRQVG
uniref:Enhancer of rudimentary homolog n=1 Tax=Chromera velia CCMP2878 TaxID=1169474 RepID=A0A0G4FYA5_9ALVE|mmetsp:Transcript_50951/g.100149  ORF Transcript_50951/g.100149 Transcript_50951/m.100149 type:complete len:104 (+) Transcript_50951:181-492(+)|eukprot:Cvel_19270.t1-p1 / transcript=Cvel_19270.t1 / gene=Cvel_19270 / organism=Chromera_velia_CCMP2878 / gene_product=Enhancer of rudimentary homolog, putative / transcript_product=Enhancer of rudimentary homolog, putative / location=Cvel_scaffold1650:3045-5778(-) / protein_length=103 / sequence_SO=supercontig / SO=protein_coding / is_pseudo=false